MVYNTSIIQMGPRNNNNNNNNNNIIIIMTLFKEEAQVA